VVRIGSKMGIDATKPPLSDPERGKILNGSGLVNVDKIRREDYI
jgi:hypothetical protein